jgi:hypothetical protein
MGCGALRLFGADMRIEARGEIDRILEGLELLRQGDYWRFNGHCVASRSDGRDVGQVLRFLLGPQEPQILDLLADDMTGPYAHPAPTWVAGALIAMRPV